jgi:hypothetical protein
LLETILEWKSRRNFTIRPNLQTRNGSCITAANLYKTESAFRALLYGPRSKGEKKPVVRKLPHCPVWEPSQITLLKDKPCSDPWSWRDNDVLMSRRSMRGLTSSWSRVVALSFRCDTSSQKGKLCFSLRAFVPRATTETLQKVFTSRKLVTSFRAPNKLPSCIRDQGVSVRR